MEVEPSAHFVDAERGLLWTRRAAIIGWGIILYAQGYTPAFNAVWLTYAGCLIYMSALHWRVRGGRVGRATSWVATVCDSIITFFMCALTGGVASPFLPFFYFMTLAGAFRFGVNEMIQVLVLNGASIVALHFLSQSPGMTPLLLALFYLGFAAALGAMLAGWAHTNLEVALAHSAALRVERDRSNALLHKLIDTQEEERKRLAEDLHDRMGARLFHLQHGLDECSRLAAHGTDMQARFSVMRREVSDCNSDVRSLMNELRPNVLDDFGFLEALSEYLTNLVGITPFPIKTRLDPALHGWRSRQDAMLFRLVQEALLNVRKHASAKHVTLSMERQSTQIALEICDDGIGFNPANIPVGHFGLSMMRERAQAAGGTLAVLSKENEGTKIRITFPVNL